MSSNANSTLPDYALSQSGQVVRFSAFGDWTLHNIGPLDSKLTGALEALDYDCVEYDFSGVTNLDTAGAFMFARPPITSRQWYDSLTRVGEATGRFVNEFVETIAFIGKFFVVLFKMLSNPASIRWKSVVALIEEIGLNAVRRNLYGRFGRCLSLARACANYHSDSYCGPL